MILNPSSLKITAGRYIVAVSGGVDSMVLLDVLRQKTGVECIVVHVNHGIRQDSRDDEALVRQFCMSHNIRFVYARLHLNNDASEQTARQARYLFLQQCRIKYKAKSILTAHHQDDVIETALINIMRGTGWRGIAPFVLSPLLLRPLLAYTKGQLLSYAKTQKVPWHEDSTNTSQKYLRNYVRHSMVPWLNRYNSNWREDFLQLVRKQQQLRRTIEDQLMQIVMQHSTKEVSANYTQRYLWCMIPRQEAYEILQSIFKTTCGYSLLREQAESALLFAKVAKPGKIMLLNVDWQVRVTRRQFIVEPRTAVVQ